MSSKTYSLINTELHKPIRSTSLANDRNGIDYRDIQLQEIVREAFQDIFPSIVQIDQKWVYQLLSKSGKDRCSRATTISQYKDIPDSEINRLLEGWIVLRRIAMEGGISNNLHSILLNFRVPHPEKAIDCYRIERKNGKEKLIVLWGYESDSAPSMSLEKALALMLGVQREGLNKMLRNSVAELKQGERIKIDTDFVNAIPQAVPSASVLVSTNIKAQKKKKNYMALVALLIVALGASLLWGAGFFKKDTHNLSQQNNNTPQKPLYFSEPSSPDINQVTPTPPQPISTTSSTSLNTPQPPKVLTNEPAQQQIVFIDPNERLLGELQKKRDSRASLINFFKSEKSVRETKQGLLKPGSNASDNVKSVISEENQDRLALFSLTSKIEDISMATAIATFATSMGVDITQNESKTILRIHGSNTVGASLAPKLVTQFLKNQGVSNISINKNGVESIISYQDGDVENIIEIKAHGSSTAFGETDSSKNVGLSGGFCDLGMSSRQIKSKEVTALMEKGFDDLSLPGSEHPIALDGVAVILHPNNPISQLTVKQIADIYSGKIKNWNELGGKNQTITILARDNQSGTWDTFKSRVLKPFKYSLSESGVTRYEDSLLLANTVAKDESSIGFCGLAYVSSSVKGLAVQAGDYTTAFEPNRLTVKTQDYPLARLLYFYLPSNAPEIAHDFVNFTMSNEGQQVVDKAGLVGQGLSTQADFSNADSYKKKLLQNNEISEDYKNIIRNADRRDTQANLRFASGSMNLDVNSQNNTQRLVSFLAERGNEDLKIKLIGFTDSTGSAQRNLTLSKQRAEAVAEMLKLKGVSGVSSHGFGEAMPVADNATAEGKEQNRRVEIWLQR